MANTEFSNKLNAALRYGATTAGTGLTLLAVMSVLTPEQVADLKQQITILNDSVITAYGALTKMWIIAGPVAIAMLAKVGWNSSSVQALAAKLSAIAKNDSDPKATDAKVAIVNAAADQAVSGPGAAVVAPALAPIASTSDNVVASAADVKH